MPTLKTINLRCQNPSAQQAFYCNVLGMKVFSDGTVGYSQNEAVLKFLSCVAPYSPTSTDVYWKIALAVPDIELACQQLEQRGVTVQEPRQFQDIGYLAHISDPEGFTIELIEHWFKGNRQNQVIDTTRLGGGAHLNLLTLRASEIDAIIERCANWGMQLLSIQPVDGYAFTLYFFAFTDDTPPSSDPHAIENREWLYQRPYTILEVQHLHEPSQMCLPEQGVAGYAGAVFTGAEQESTCAQLLLTVKT